MAITAAAIVLAARRRLRRREIGREVSTTPKEIRVRRHVRKEEPSKEKFRLTEGFDSKRRRDAKTYEVFETDDQNSKDSKDQKEESE